jgi:uncharacterized membrane protein YdjX (TVP38/TMEM64 family)
MKRTFILRLLVLALLVMGMVAVVALPPVRVSLTTRAVALLEAVRELGVWGLALIVAAYVIAGILAFPALVLSWGAGFIYGMWVGTVAASVGNTLGAAAAFLVGRTLARRVVERQVARDARFRAIDHAVANDGFKIVLLIRLAPVIPFNVMSYVFALTRVRFRDFFGASAIGMFPATAVNVYIGSLLSSLTELDSLPAEASGVRQTFFYAGLAMTIVAIVYVTRVARAALLHALPTGRIDESLSDEL